MYFDASLNYHEKLGQEMIDFTSYKLFFLRSTAQFFTPNYWLSCQAMPDIKKDYDGLIIIKFDNYQPVTKKKKECAI